MKGKIVSAIAGLLWIGGASAWAQGFTPEPIPPVATLDPAFITRMPEAMPEITAEATAAISIDGTIVPTPTLAPTNFPISLESAEALPSLVSARGDLDLLADAAFPAGRPQGWTGFLDVSSPDLALFIRLDLEILVGSVMGAEIRPNGWFGVIPSTPLAVARDIRHDLELLADVVVGTSTVRPGGWAGDDPLMRCSRATQSLIAVLIRSGYGLNIDFTQPDACLRAEIESSRFVERQVVQPPSAVGSIDTDTNSRAAFEPYQVDSQFVVAFYDRNARERAGVVPMGTGFRPVGKSDFSFSNMMLIEGQGFQIFVDYTTTTVTFNEFSVLQGIGDGDPTTNCDVDWCE